MINTICSRIANYYGITRIEIGLMDISNPCHICLYGNDGMFYAIGIYSLAIYAKVNWK